MFGGQEPLHPRLRQDCVQEPTGDSAFQQPVPVLREGRMIPGRVVDPEPDEPAEQQIELQPLHQLPLGPDRIERLQQHGPQQLLGRDRRAACAGIESREIRFHGPERLVDHHPDRPQRMVRPDPRLQVHIAEQRARLLVRPPQITLQPDPHWSESRQQARRERLLQHPARSPLPVTPAQRPLVVRG